MLKLVSSSIFLPLLLVSARAADWRPIDREELNLKSPKVEKDAHAEALFWEVHVTDEGGGGSPYSVLNHYVRIKVFDERGVEDQSKVDLLYAGKTSISDIAGRATQPDGSVAELKKDAIFDRMVAKTAGIKVKAKSFVLPGVAPGSIVEYRWREKREDQLANYVRLYLQRDIPVQSVTYYLKPLQNPYFPFGMRSIEFNCPNIQWVKQKDGFYSTTLTNMPAYREEPSMPPEHQVRAWILVYYSKDMKLSPEQYWKTEGMTIYRASHELIKVNDEVKRTAARVMEDASTPEEKLRRLFHYCQANIKNVHDAGSGLSAEDRAAMKQNKTPADTIRQGAGTGYDIDMLFAALAQAAGFDARWAMLSDRSEWFLQPNTADTYFLNTYEVAILMNGQWKFFDPASTYIPFGMLRWQEEGVLALVSDPKDPPMLRTPVSTSDKSKSRRKGTFTLSGDGSLEGDVQLEYTGHSATDRRRSYQAENNDERDETVRTMVKEQFANAEVTAIRIDGLANPDKPFGIGYHVKIDGYAQRTGKRLLVPTSYFQINRSAMFTAGERRNPVYFPYPWSEDDEVSIQVPAGFALDNAQSPKSANIGNAGRYKVQASFNTAERKLVYTRDFAFAESTLLFPQDKYAAVKQAFDYFHNEDGHVITLKQGN